MTCATCEYFRKDGRGWFCGLTGKNVPGGIRGLDCVNHSKKKGGKKK